VLRVVPDTNVYVSALHFGGLPLELLLLGTGDEVTIFTSPAILAELAGVLTAKFHWNEERVREAVVTLRQFVIPVEPRRRVRIIRADEADNRILECALAVGADRIVSGDHHLLDLGQFRGILIQTPRAFIESISHR
jgi:uncharacterized protein